MEPIKILKKIAFTTLVVATASVFQKLHIARARGWLFENGDVYDIIFRIALMVYAAIWFGAIVTRMHLAVILTSITLFFPCVMGAYNMIAIWFEDKNVVLNAWITICIGAGLILYVKFVWQWWVKRRTPMIGMKSENR